MESPIIGTKINVPINRKDGVRRQRLLDLIQNGVSNQCKLTLISAPAGYGKTTLVTDWITDNCHIQSKPCRVAWYSLDQFDNSLEQFISYWLSALQRINVIDADFINNLTPQFSYLKPSAFVSSLVDPIISQNAQIVFVLDDFHVISNPEIHGLVEKIVEYMPGNFHVIVITREDPILPLSRLRVRSQMVEIRARDLRFTSQEANDFFSQTMNLQLNQEIIAVLESRTEGWAAGLQLAALAIKNNPDPKKFIETFGGSHRYVLDYLAEEVLSSLPAYTREFLVQTSILDRFNYYVCEAITGRDDSEAILEKLIQTNMFIIPLDNEQGWYRYHHLFANFLLTELDDQMQKELYQKASLWFEANGFERESVRYALASKNDHFAADIIERVMQKGKTWSGGDLHLITKWISSLPDEAFATRPFLSLQASRLFYLSVNFEKAESLLDQTEKFLEDNQNHSFENKKLLGMTSTFRGAIAAMRGETNKALAHLDMALPYIDKDDFLTQARSSFSFGQANELMGKTDDAVRNYLDSSRLALKAGVIYLAVNALCTAALAQISQGNLSLAEKTCQQALDLTGNEHIPPHGLALSILGAIAYEKFDLDLALHLIKSGLELSNLGGLKDDLAMGLIFLERVFTARGENNQAQVFLEQAIAILNAYGIRRFTNLGAACSARFQLEKGNKNSALFWAEKFISDRNLMHAKYLSEFEDLLLCRILLECGTIENVPTILEPLEKRTRLEGRERFHLEAMLLLAIYYQTKKDMPQVMFWLEKALESAENQGQKSLFLIEAKSLLNLLPRLRAAAPNLVDAIIAKVHSEEFLTPEAFKKLIDPLSEQETKVLNLIIAGKSNQEIASELYISNGTAKWHVHNILQKIGASNRYQAIVLARELKL
ncbi:MAG: hypothetical protein CVU42_07635 [Chloroflexi bacterium HGW-Chloroflexi-4]|jgi:LuxR family maltose regulon positive regulatory protein|nr:MAG: hypothetical protein CVU42_07635 [Chloroflexi bacterium HGW-Chloroflexi-4]